MALRICRSVLGGSPFARLSRTEVRFTACNSSFFSTKSDATNTVITQTKLVEKLAAKTELPKTEVLAILRALAETVNEEVLINGVDVRIAKLGTFKRKELLARKGRNPKTGEELDIMPKNSVKFMASSSLKESPSTA
ncbi:bacterial DNA-binding protein-domain-containing protein [Ochromonadaceae sp. CCMP2298]|nr:bacterial DNA-binding protein-domain-containing protein [Ochromonadaceae sp. CCMP2298]